MPLYQSLGTGDYRIPVPMMNIINGGEHADNSVDHAGIHDSARCAGSIREAVRYGAEVFHALKSVLGKRALATTVGDEGGFAPICAPMKRRSGHLEAINRQASRRAGHLPRSRRRSSGFFNGRYVLASGRQVIRFGRVRPDFLAGWVDQYPIISVEDGMDEGDWAG